MVYFFGRQKGLLFLKTLDGSNYKSNKILVDKSRGFYHRSMKSRLQDNDIKMYSTRNEGNKLNDNTTIHNIESLK